MTDTVTPAADQGNHPPDADLEQLRHTADTQRARLLAFFEQAPVAIAVFQGPVHVFELGNARYMAMTGQRDLVGLPVRTAFPEIGESWWLSFDAVYRTGVPYIAHELRQDIDRGRGEVEESYWTFNLHPMLDAAGVVAGIMSVTLDTTETVLARRTLEAANAERDQLLVREQAARCEADLANRTKDEFLAMLGHELRNPLAPILTALTIMRMSGAASRESDIIERQVHSLVRLVDDLLDVSRIARGQVVLRPEPIEVAAIITAAIEMASPTLEQRRHRLVTDVPLSGLTVDADPARMVQVLSNILTNAAKYTATGGRIAITAWREGDQAMISIADDGMGIAPDLLSRIFDMFIQAPQTTERSQGGLGLGLSIAHSLVTLHGGSVSAHSAGLGTGSTFTVELPVAEGLPAVVPARTPPARVHGIEPTHARVLVVDDNVDAAEMMAASLELFGFIMHTAGDGPSAITEAGTFRPDVALVDIGLPVMDGYELAGHLRHGFGDDLLLVAVTGYGQESDRRRAMSAGFDHHMVKPVDIDKIVALLGANPPRRRQP